MGPGAFVLAWMTVAYIVTRAKAGKGGIMGDIHCPGQNCNQTFMVVRDGACLCCHCNTTFALFEGEVHVTHTIQEALDLIKEKKGLSRLEGE